MNDMEVSQLISAEHLRVLAQGVQGWARTDPPLAAREAERLSRALEARAAAHRWLRTESSPSIADELDEMSRALLARVDVLASSLRRCQPSVVDGLCGDVLRLVQAEAHTTAAILATTSLD